MLPGELAADRGAGRWPALPGWAGRDVLYASQFVVPARFDPEDVVLVVRVDKVLERDPARAVDVYCRADDERADLDALAAAARGNAARSCGHLLSFRTPLAWAAVSLKVRRFVII